MSKITLSAAIAEEIIKYIEEKGLVEGDRIPNEFELSELLDVSRITIREAIKILSARGKVEIRRGIGTFVCSHSIETEEFIDFSEMSDEAIAQQSFETRCLLEPLIASIAAQKSTPEDIAALDELVDQIKSRYSKYVTDVYSDEEMSKIFIDHELAFHTQLAKCSQNIFLERFTFHTMQAYITSYWAVNFTPQDLKFNYYHESVVAAVKAKDPELAREVMYRHLVYTEKWTDQVPQLPRQHK